MKPKFNYDDIVYVRPEANIGSRAGKRAWIVGIFEKRPEGGYFDQFPTGVVYTLEFEDGSSIEVHEGNLQFHE